MTLEQIISLTQAGFTKDDIYAMLDSDTNPNQTSLQPPTAAQAAPAQVPAPAPTPAPALAPALAQAPAVGTAPVYMPQQVPASTPTPAPAPAPTPAQNNEQDLMQKILNSMNSLNSTMQKTNMMGVIQPQTPSTDDMLAAIINPPTLKEVN